MQGCLALHRGVLYVGSQEKTGHVRLFDLDGRRLAGGFSFRDPTVGRSVVAGLAVDDDRTVWVADTAAARVRGFTVFGRELKGLGVSPGSLTPPAPPINVQQHEGMPDVPGALGHPVDVAVAGSSEERTLVVASGGERRHAVQVFAENGSLLASLRPGGDPAGRFHGVRGVALSGRLIFVCEWGRGRVQVYRDGGFHFEFPSGSRERRPTAVAPLPDGRSVVCWDGAESAVGIVDASGRPQRTLAAVGEGEGRVLGPSDVAVDLDPDAREARVAVVDRDGLRVQVFTLEGRLSGAFEARAV